jgi:hypothetical protein
MDLLCNSCKMIGTCDTYALLRRVHPVFCDNPKRDEYLKKLQAHPHNSDQLNADPATFHYN